MKFLCSKSDEIDSVAHSFHCMAKMSTSFPMTQNQYENKMYVGPDLSYGRAWCVVQRKVSMICYLQ